MSADRPVREFTAGDGSGGQRCARSLSIPGCAFKNTVPKRAGPRVTSAAIHSWANPAGN